MNVNNPFKSEYFHFMNKNILITWNIDGTLITGSDEVISIHINAFKHACEDLFYIKFDTLESFLQVPMNGLMDQKILKMIIKKCGYEPTQDLLDNRLFRKKLQC